MAYDDAGNLQAEIVDCGERNNFSSCFNHNCQFTIRFGNCISLIFSWVCHFVEQSQLFTVFHQQSQLMIIFHRQSQLHTILHQQCQLMTVLNQQSQLITVVHQQSQLITVVHQQSQLITVVHQHLHFQIPLQNYYLYHLHQPLKC